MRILYTLIFIIPLSLDIHGSSAEIFGALGDGVTDDTKAIQTALDAGRGVVDLPAGRYRLSDSLYIPSNSGLRGTGTLVQSADVTTLLNAKADTEARDIRIEGIRIEKRFVDNSVHEGIRLVGTKQVRIHGVEVTGMSAVSGIYLNQCENFSIRDCYVHDFILSATSRPLPGGKGPDALGIHLRDSRFGQVIGNRIENLNVTLESAEAMDYQTDGINALSCRHVVFANNVVRNVGEGIDLCVCESCTVTGNVFEDCWHF